MLNAAPLNTHWNIQKQKKACWLNLGKNRQHWKHTLIFPINNYIIIQGQTTIMAIAPFTTPKEESIMSGMCYKDATYQQSRGNQIWNLPTTTQNPNIRWTTYQKQKKNRELKVNWTRTYLSFKSPQRSRYLAQTPRIERQSGKAIKSLILLKIQRCIRYPRSYNHHDYMGR